MGTWLPDALMKVPPQPDALGLVVRPIYSGSVPGAQLTYELPSTSSSFSSFQYSAGTVTVAAANSSRRGMLAFNNSTETFYIKLGAGASATDWIVELVPGAHWTMDSPVSQEIVTGCWASSGSGDVKVQELT